MPVGFVYVLINPSFPGLVKIGCTAGSAEERARQLSAATAVPQPYLVTYCAAVSDMEEAERRVHRILEARGLRLTASREFFQATPTEAIDALLRVVETLREEAVPIGAACESAQEDLDEGERFRKAARNACTGDGDTLRDVGEAVRLYHLAIAHGSREAQLELGRVYAEEDEVCDVSLAQRHLRMAAESGVPRGWAYLAWAFASSRALDNALKCWKRAWESDENLTDGGWLGHRYLLCLTRNMPHKFPAELAKRYELTKRHLSSLSESYRRKHPQQHNPFEALQSRLAFVVHGHRIAAREKGTVHRVFREGHGVIHGEDGSYYEFSSSDPLPENGRLEIGYKVEFESSCDGESRTATNIMILRR